MTTVRGQASQTVVDLTDGYTVWLSQDSASWNGGQTSLGGTGQEVTITAYAKRGMSNASFSIGTCTCSDSTNCSATPSGSTVTISVGANATEGGTVTIPVVISAGNETITVTKTFSYGINLQGPTGPTGPGAYKYTLNASADTVVKATDNTIAPTKITFSSTRAQGTGSPSSYSGRFKIETTTDGSTWTTGYTSSSNESSKEYTIPTTTIPTLVRCTLYLAGGTSTVLDIKTVPIISPGVPGSAGKGVSGITGHYLATSASSGVTTSTSGWSTSVQTMTATNKYLWYYETISYTNPTSSENTTPCIVGVYGDKGNKGDEGDPAIHVVITGETIIRNSANNVVLTASVYVGGAPASVNSSTGVVTYDGNTIGTIKWYNGTSGTGTAGGTHTVTPSNVDGDLVVYAKLEA